MRAGPLVLALVVAGPACLVHEPLQELPEPTSAHETRRTPYPDGSVRSERRLLVWSDGRIERDGAERDYHPDGTLAAERFFERDRHVGTWRTWYSDGAPRSEIDLGADASGTATQRFWHPTGALAAEGPVRGGKRDGRWRYFDAEGRVEREGGYRDGRRDGPWTFHRSDGSIEAEGWYALGERVGVWLLRDDAGVAHARSASDGELPDP